MTKVLAHMLGPGSHLLRLNGGALLSLTLTILLFSFTGCKNQERNTIQRLKYEDSVWSMSLSGSNRASVVNKKTRDLRLTNDAGRNWQVIPSTSVGDAFECAFMLNENWGWAVN